MPRATHINVPLVFLAASCVLGFAVVIFLVSGGASVIGELRAPEASIKQWGMASCRRNRDCDAFSTCIEGMCVPSLCGDGSIGNNERCEYPSVQVTNNALCPVETQCERCLCVQQTTHPVATDALDGAVSSQASSSSSGLRWEEAPSLPRELSDAAVAVFRDALWVAGGISDADSPVAKVFSTVDGREWQTKSPLPMQLSLHGAASYQSRLWIVGGRDQWGKASAFVFVTEDGASWKQASPLPRPLFGHAVAVFGGRIWAMGGQTTEGKESREAYSYDAINERWQAEEALPRALVQGMAVVFRGRLWIMGGFPSSADVYSTADGKEWRKEGALPASLSRATGVVHSDLLWLIGGAGDGTSLRQIFSTSDGQTWSEEGQLPVQLERHGALSWQGRIWLLGGGIVPTARVFVAPPLSEETQGNVGFDEVRRARERIASWDDRAVLSSTADGKIMTYTDPEDGVATIVRRLVTERFWREDLLSSPTLEFGAYSQPTISADGRFVVVREYQWFCRQTCVGKLWLLDTKNGTRTVIAPAPAIGTTGEEDAISRDGLKVVFLTRPESLRGLSVLRATGAAGSELFVWHRTGEIVQIPVAKGPPFNPRFADEAGRFVTYGLTNGTVHLYDMETGRDSVVPIPMGISPAMLQVLIQQMVDEMQGDAPIRPLPNPTASSSSRPSTSPFTTAPPSLFRGGSSASSAGGK